MQLIKSILTGYKDLFHMHAGANKRSRWLIKWLKLKPWVAFSSSSGPKTILERRLMKPHFQEVAAFSQIREPSRTLFCTRISTVFYSIYSSYQLWGFEGACIVFTLFCVFFHIYVFAVPLGPPSSIAEWGPGPLWKGIPGWP